MKRAFWITWELVDLFVLLGNRFLGGFFLDLWWRPTGHTRIFMKSAEIFKIPIGWWIGRVPSIGNFCLTKESTDSTGGSMVLVGNPIKIWIKFYLYFLGTNQMYHSQNSKLVLLPTLGDSHITYPSYISDPGLISNLQLPMTKGDN